MRGSIGGRRALLRQAIDNAVTEATQGRADEAGSTWHGDLLQALLARGNGAMLQRRVHESTGDLAAVVRNAVSHTLSVE